MANLNESLRNMNFESAAARGSTDVTVSAFGNNALKGILEAISRQSSIITSLEDEVESLRETQSKQNNDNRKEDRKNNLASDAANRKSRATNAAMYGEIKKGNVFNKMLREGLMSALEGLTGFLKENLNKALKTQADLATIMRKANLTHDQKNQIQDLAISMKGILAKDFADLNISNAQAKEYIADLISAGKDVTRMSKEELAGYMALRRRNMDADKAYELSKVSTYDSMKNLANSLADNQINSSLNKALSMFDENKRYTMGGTDKFMAQMTDAIKAVETKYGSVLSSEQSAEMAALIVKRQNPELFKDITTDAESAMIAQGGGANVSTEEFLDNIVKGVNKATTGGNVLPSYLAVIKEAQKNGKETGKELYTDDQIKEANETNTAEGKLPSLFEDVFNSTLGKITGPLSNTLDEWFGEGVDITKIVGTGFKIVIGLLGSLVAKNFDLPNLPGKLFDKLGGKLGSFAKSISSSILGVAKGLGGKLVGIFKGLGTKLGGMGKLGKGLGIAGGVVALLAMTGALDGLKPILDDILSTVAPILSDLTNTLGPVINDLLSSLGPVLQDLVSSLGSALGDLVKALVPILDGVLKAITPILNSIFKALTPILTSIFKSLTPILTSIFKVLTPIIDTVVKTVLPIFNTLINAVMPIIKTVFDVLTPILETILKSIGPVLSIIAKVLTPVLEVVGKVLQSVAPILEVVLKPISVALDLLTTPLQIIADIMQKKELTEDAGKANSALKNAKKNNNTELEKEIQFVLNAQASNYKVRERRKNESEEDYYHSLYKDITTNGTGNFLKGAFTGTHAVTGRRLLATKDQSADQLAKSRLDILNNAIKHNGEKFTDPTLDDFLGKDIDDWKKMSANELNKEWSSIFPDEDGRRAAIAMLLGEAEAEKAIPKKLAIGGVFNQATNAIVGEAGKEAVLPLTKPDQLLNILNKLNLNERSIILKSLLSSKNFSFKDFIASIVKYNNNNNAQQQNNTQINKSNAQDQIASGDVPGDDPATIRKILSFAGPYAGIVYQRLLHGWQNRTKDGFKQRKKWYEEALANAANQEGRELIRGTYAERALEYGISELGKPYILRSLGKIGYVCNELVNACIQASGFNMGKFRVHGVKATFANIQKGKYQGEEYPNFRIRDDLTPQTAIPGMVFFQDARKNKEGGFQPGHIGLVYYGHQKLHAAGGSAKYTKNEFLPNWQTPCRGVTVTPFDGSSYVIGEFPGLFEQATGEWKAPTNSSIKFGPGYTADTSAEDESSKLSALVDESIFTNSASLHDFISQFIGTDYQNLQSSSMYSELVADYESAIADIAASSSLEAKRNAIEFSKSALNLLGNKRTSPEVLEALSTMIKYLRDIALSPANKKAVTPVSRPVNASFA